MLDWTRNAFVAAFFALADYANWVLAEGITQAEEQKRRKTNQHVAIWQLDCSEGLFRKSEFELVEAKAGFGERQKAQSGLFTRLADTRYTDLVSYLSDRGVLDALLCLDIPTKCVGEALTDLHDQGIHYASLFPDVVGAVIYANDRHFVKPRSLGELLNQ